MTVRIGTRASALALWQAEHVKRLLQRAWPELTCTLVPITTTGDRILDRPLAAIGGKGLFVKELEAAMLDGEIDIAVHSMKDMPTLQPAGLALDIVVPRASAFDVLCGREQAYTLQTLPHGARVGTGSQRRTAQLLAARPDLQIVPLRGNVLTRLQRRVDDDLHAVVLAEAGLQRLDIWEDTFTVIDADVMIPAPGQGAVTVEYRANDTRCATWLRAIHCQATDDAVRAERACLRAIGGDCHTPFAAWASNDGDHWTLRARMYDGPYAADVRVQRDVATLCTPHDFDTFGDAAGRLLLQRLDEEKRG